MAEPVLNPGIAELVEGSAVEILYKSLLAAFSEAAEYTLPDMTGAPYIVDGVVNEGAINAAVANYESITRRNSAYAQAKSVISSLTDSGFGSGGGGYIGNFLLKTGDSMSGALMAKFGFDAGVEGNTMLSLGLIDNGDGTARKVITITGELHLGGTGLYLNNFQAIEYLNNILKFKTASSYLFDGDINVTNTSKLTIGLLELSNNGIRFDGREFYHTQNANLQTIDWSMKDGTVAGDLTVSGDTDMTGELVTHGNVTHKIGNLTKFAISTSGATLNGNLNITTGGIQFDGQNAFYIKNAQQVSLSAPGYNLLFGEGANYITLMGDVHDQTTAYTLITKLGAAYFPMGLRASHNKSVELLQTYANGVIFSKNIKLYDADGPALICTDGTTLDLCGEYYYTESGNRLHTTKKVSLSYALSNSYYTPLNSTAVSLMVGTTADFIEVDSILEATQIGIRQSYTKLSDNQLFLQNGVYLQGITGAIKEYGDLMLEKSVGSFTFSSGFAGSGWRIYKNVTSGNVVATFDELVVRKKMRVYELEVQKISATNGSLWVSDSCSGDFAVEVV